MEAVHTTNVRAATPQAEDHTGLGRACPPRPHAAKSAALLADRGNEHIVGFASNSLAIDIKGAKVGGTGRPRRSRGPGRPWSSCLAARSCGPRRAWFARCTFLTGRSRRPGLTGCTLFSRRPGRADFAALPLRSGGTLQTCFALRSCRPHRSARSLRAGRTRRGAPPAALAPVASSACVCANRS
jgi:hypothetical protein